MSVLKQNRLRELISIRDHEPEELVSILDEAAAIEAGVSSPDLSGKLAALLFLEPSTRTHFSFDSAMKRLGGETLSLTGSETSSAKKGESLADTLRTIGLYVDLIVVRSAIEGTARFAAEVSGVPVINAGDGANQHPTQALLDLYAIRKTKGRLENLTVGILGDLKFGRAVHSLVDALSGFQPMLHLISPPHLALPPRLLEELDDSSARYAVHTSPEAVIGELDILYVTRIQRERFADPEEYEQVKGSYRVDRELLSSGNPTLRVLHPLPRVDEIAEEVDNSEHAYYFPQARGGVVVREAILAKMIGGRL